ncbi:mercury transport protein [uncultured Bradyrhizobium sp.]|uniref:mercury transport protein n=1 Tax=uncultured Bradyrhizobium sp. TaxID=199684 RepID=UPI0026134489|nr:mercury transport protein [uncultured Bradyrhizobium sp.]
MNDRVLIRASTAGAVLAVICCAAPLLAGVLPLAGLGAWVAGAGLVVLPLVIACFGLVAWGIHRRRARADCGETKIHKEGVKP